MKALRWTLSLDTFSEDGEHFSAAAAALRALAGRLEKKDQAEGLMEALLAHGLWGLDGHPVLNQSAERPASPAEVAELEAAPVEESWKCLWKVEERE